MRIQNFAVDHSLFGASAWAVETSAGWVVYSGDLRLHGSNADSTRRFVEAASRLHPIALVIEGTRINQNSTHTESGVRDACPKAVQECSGLVVADFGPRNIERLLSFLEIARQTGRKLAILPKDAYLLDAMHLVNPSEVPGLDDGGFSIYWEYVGSSNKWRDQVANDYPQLAVTPRDVSANQDKFICCFSYWDVQELAYIKPVPGSRWIYSSCEAFSEEMAIDAQKLKLWIDHFGMELLGTLLPGEEPDCPYHVSGHASGDDLIEIVKTIRPKTLIPVHTEHPEVYADRVGDICTVTIPERGVPIVV